MATITIKVENVDAPQGTPTGQELQELMKQKSVVKPRELKANVDIKSVKEVQEVKP